MKIGVTDFLNIVYTVLNDSNIYELDLVELIEYLKIINYDNEFEDVDKRLILEEITEDNVVGHKYTLAFDPKGILHFNIPKEEREKIINEHRLDAAYIQQVINKRRINSEIREQTHGIAELHFDGLNGEYAIPKASIGDQKAEAMLFTDGICTNNRLVRSSVASVLTRFLSLEDATFSFLVYYINSEIDKIEVRGCYEGDYQILLTEVKRIINDTIDNYDLVTNEAPKVYKFKCH